MTRSARGPRRWGGLTAALLLTVFSAGCGSDIYPVEGKVVWKDGSPATELKSALVIFNQAARQTRAQGQIQEDGSFHLTTNKPNDGALAGEHEVLIIEVARKHLGGADPSALAPGAMDSRYSDPRTSGLTAAVKPGTNQITLTVERYSRR
jgi:hypothetical protein